MINIDFDPPPSHEAEIDEAFGHIIEGMCPRGHGPLERRTNCGWCAQCDRGWAGRIHRHNDDCCPCSFTEGEPVLSCFLPVGVKP